MNVLFSQPRSSAEPSFWIAIGGHKLNIVRLGEESIPVVGRMGVEGRPGGLRDNCDVGDTCTSGGAGEAPPSSSARRAHVEPRVRLDEESLALLGANKEREQDQKQSAQRPNFVRNECLYVPTHIKCLNLLETFKSINKNAFLDENAEALLRTCGASAGTTSTITGHDVDADADADADADTDEEDEDLSHLLTTVCLSHLDLKKHVYLYWFAFPSIIPRKGRAVQYADGDSQTSLIETWGLDAVKVLRWEYHQLRLQRLARCVDAATTSNPDHIDNTANYGCPPFFLIVRDEESGTSSGLKCVELSKKSYDQLSDSEKESVVFGFLDTCTDTCTAHSAGGSVGGAEQEYAPVGWSLRNMVAYLSLRLGLAGREVRIVSYRPAVLRRIGGESRESGPFDESDDIVRVEDASLLLRIVCPLESDYDWSDQQSLEQQNQQQCQHRPLCRTTGFEPNTRGRPGPRTVNLSPLLSPQHLAAQASDLNLRLMKWRAVPNLDLEKLRSLKVLLLGSGTLGCGVARTLQGWGVRDMTLVDNGRVSYSNPVRQSLFVLEDCVDGGKPKATAAAESLERIAGEANIKASGIHLTIPMPGHPFGSEKAEESARRDGRILSDLIKDCDVVFLLTDTRESRWLPTVMARAEGKMLINAALGLDSWLVMRHGGEASRDDESGIESTDNTRLGCYFCNDVVAPENSTNNRTLDQQCTVTRPGIASIASSIAVELMVSLLHHPLGHAAPAPKPATGGGSSAGGSGGLGSSNAADGAYRPVVEESDANASPLGLMPHQIRGSIASYTLMTPTVPAFIHCAGCSSKIVDAYRSRGFDFVKDVCNCIDGKLLDDVSGLTEYRRKAESMMEAAMEDWDDDDDEEEEEK